jgi:hypothetical protein
MIEFEKWSKTTRLESDVTISEKANGSNVAICAEIKADGDDFNISLAAQTRTQMVHMGNDQVGVAKWTIINYQSLIYDLFLGDGVTPPKPGIYRHFGEFMTRGHKEPHLYLFNTKRWSGKTFATPTLKVVPVLFEGRYYEGIVEKCLEDLRTNGSRIHPGIAPEGVVTYWHGDNSMKKSYTGLVKQ